MMVIVEATVHGGVDVKRVLGSEKRAQPLCVDNLMLTSATLLVHV